MTSGHCCFLILEKDNAVSDWRNLMLQIRDRYGKNIMHNVVHGSDSEENALIEISFFNKL